MTFPEARRKESWFFDTLFRDDEEMKDLCGINNLRAMVIDLYDTVVSEQIKLDAPDLFRKTITFGTRMKDEWNWSPDEECYENSAAMMQKVHSMINAMVNTGKSTSKPCTVEEILIREDVTNCFAQCLATANTQHHSPQGTTADPARSVMENCKRHLLELMDQVVRDLVANVHMASKSSHFKRFLTIGAQLVRVMVYLASQCFKQVQAQLDDEIARLLKKHAKRQHDLKKLTQAFVRFSKRQLIAVAQMVHEFPRLPTRYLSLEPPSFLAHAEPITVALTVPFSFICNTGGEVINVVDAKKAPIPIGATIRQFEALWPERPVEETKFTEQRFEELQDHNGPVLVTFISGKVQQSKLITPDHGRGPFGFLCNEAGRIEEITQPECPVPRSARITHLQAMTPKQSAKQEYSIENLSSFEGGDLILVTYLPPNMFVISSDPKEKLTEWLYHKDHVRHVYLEERETFLSFRRAAEIITLVFHEETDGVQARGEFERMCRGQYGAKSRDRRLVHVETRGFKIRPSPLPRSDIESGLMLQKDVHGSSCSTPGCDRTHDTAFNPCGHTVCCWECAVQYHECPVCGIDLSQDIGVRPARSLCYEYDSDGSGSRMTAAQDNDARVEEQVKVLYAGQLVAFVKADDSDLKDAQRLLDQMFRDQRSQLDARAVQGKKPYLWPSYQHWRQSEAEWMAKIEQMEGEVYRVQHERDRIQQEVERLQQELRRTDPRCRNSEWKFNAIKCTQCHEGFSMLFTPRKHHCRGCGFAFCDTCAPEEEFDTADGFKPTRFCALCQQDLEVSGGVECGRTQLRQHGMLA
jgi:hypothetical protein|eukprot:SAG25_NODE_530_length_7159_cov_113.818697_3_plen_808_part_00